MNVTIDLCAGPNRWRKVTKREIQKNIDALQRAVDGNPLSSDFISLLDTKSILEGIKAQLPDA